MLSSLLPILMALLPCLHAQDELWEQDLSADMKIGLSTEGYHKVDLRCGAEAFLVNVTVDDDFGGVLYTRGDFASKKQPCFYRADHGHISGQTANFSLAIPFTNCHTVEDASEAAFTNVLVLQHDSDFIFPGDAAFLLSCAFSPEQSLGTTMLSAPRTKIVLVDADPGSTKKSEEHHASSDSDRVSFPQPKTTKDEL